MAMRLTSSAFTRGGVIPRKFTCDGANISPPLIWSDAPAEVRSFAIVCSDPDAPSAVWYHWAIYDIPSETTSLPEHWPPDRAPPPQALNDFGKEGYGGPCPPRGHGRHHYHFKLYALKVERLGLGPVAKCREIEEAAQAQAITATELVGVYSR
jgi:Raf kinase inhibitor-like YbhB/YbcL family protein